MSFNTYTVENERSGGLFVVDRRGEIVCIVPSCDIGGQQTADQIARLLNAEEEAINYCEHDTGTTTPNAREDYLLSLLQPIADEVTGGVIATCSERALQHIRTFFEILQAIGVSSFSSNAEIMGTIKSLIERASQGVDVGNGSRTVGIVVSSGVIENIFPDLTAQQALNGPET